MNNKAPRLIVAGLVKKKNKYLLIRESFPDGSNMWLVPGGGVEFGESLEQAVIRELKEETDLDGKVERFLAFKEAIFPDHNYHTIIFFYLMTTKDKKIVLEKEILESGYFIIEEAKKLNIVDSALWLFENIDL